MRLGDLDALKEKLTPIKLYNGVYCKVITEKDIDNAPTVDTTCQNFRQVEPERPQGEWAFDEKGSFYCDQCSKYPHDQYATTNFCPNCGADMRKPNCVTCDHFGKCEGCEKGEEE